MIEQLAGQLGRFIPWSFEAIAQVDPVGEHGEGGGFEDEFFATFLDVLWPAEGSFFKPFGDDPISGAIEVEDFDEGLSAIGKKEGGSACGVGADLVAGKFGEAVEAFAHVAGVEGDVDFEVAIEGEHGGFKRGP